MLPVSVLCYCGVGHPERMSSNLAPTFLIKLPQSQEVFSLRRIVRLSLMGIIKGMLVIIVVGMYMLL